MPLLPTPRPSGGLAHYGTGRGGVVTGLSPKGGATGERVGPITGRRRSQCSELLEHQLVGWCQARRWDGSSQHFDRLDEHVQPVVIASGGLPPFVFEGHISDPGSNEKLGVEAAHIHASIYTIPDH